MEIEPLSPVQADVLSALRRRVEAGEPMPSYRELRDEFRWRSTGTVRDHLQALARKGYIELSGPGHRRIRLLTDRLAVKSVPLVGRVTAGTPVMAEENIERRIPVPAAWTVKGIHFALRVDGDSMVDAGIWDGDYVIVRQQKDPPTGEIVVAVIEDKTTVKRLTRQGDRFILQPENPRYRPIPVESDSAEIQGVVVGLMREYRGRGSSRWSPRSLTKSVARPGRRSARGA